MKNDKENQQKLSISAEEKNRRQKAFNYAKASMFLEGFELSDEYIQEANRFINGEIEFIQIKEKIDEMALSILNR